MVEFRRRPARRLGADAGGVAALASVAGGHVIALLGHCLGAVVAAVAIGGDAGMVEIGAQPGVSGVAVSAFQIGGNVIGRLALRLHPVMANDAETRDRQRNLGVIHGFRRIPDEHGMAGDAIVAGGGMGRSLPCARTPLWQVTQLPITSP